jgi:hypothetical protein
MAILQFKIQLKHVKPSIYRVFQVQDSINFLQMHEILQTVMGWQNCHLFQFYKDRRGETISIPYPDDDWEESLDARKIKIKNYFPVAKSTITYEYDFGDGWEHIVTLEKILDADKNTRYPVCIKGKRNCPPEDCGGPWGYENLLNILADKNHPEHNEFKDWVEDDFDPEAFDIVTVNEELEDIKIKK